MKNIKYIVLLIIMVAVSAISTSQVHSQPRTTLADVRINKSDYSIDNPLRVVFVGDSITHGIADDSHLKYGGYRGFLQELLIQQNLAFSVVGAFDDIYTGPLPPLSDFHSGIGGAGWSPQYSYVLGSVVDAWNLTKNLNPQLVFISAGINGLSLGETPTHNAEAAESLLRQMYIDVPGVCIVLGNSIPMVDNPTLNNLANNANDLNNKINKFNAILEKNVYNVLRAEGKCIFWADLNTPMSKAIRQKKLLYSVDGVHPIKDGFMVIAGAWLEKSNIFK